MGDLEQVESRQVLAEQRRVDRFFDVARQQENGEATNQALRQAAEGLVPLQVLLVAADESLRLPGARTLVDSAGMIRRGYDGTPGTAYLLRPDQHVCARWRHLSLSPDAARSALRRALALQRAHRTRETPCR